MKLIDLNEDNEKSFAELLEDDLTENIERQNYYGLVVADDENEPLAGMIWELVRNGEDNTEAHIRHIVVKTPEAGAMLFSGYEKRIAKSRVQRSVASVYIKKQSPAYEALNTAGFHMKLTEGDHITLSLGELTEMPLLKNRTVSEDVKPLYEIDPDTFHAFAANLVKIGRAGLCGDIESLPMEWFENDISCYYESKGKIKGMLLFHPQPSGKLALKLLYAASKEKKEMGLILTMMIRHMVITAEIMYSKKTLIVAERYNEFALAFSEKLFPRSIGRPVYVGERKETPPPPKYEKTDIERYLMI